MRFYVGNAAVVYAVITDDSDDSPITTGVALTIRKPDRTTEAVPVVYQASASGALPAQRWDATYLFAMGGVYHLRWTSTSPAGAQEYTMSIISSHT